MFEPWEKFSDQSPKIKIILYVVAMVAVLIVLVRAFW